MKAHYLLTVLTLVSVALKSSYSHNFGEMGYPFRVPSSSCSCEYQQTSEGMELNCNNCLSVSDLNDEIQRHSGKYTVHAMNIHNSVLMFLPTSIFRWIKMSHLGIHNSTIMGLEDDRTNSMQSSRESFKILEMEKVVGVDSWRWSAFSDLRLETVRVQNCDMYSVNKDFGEISRETLSSVVLVNSKIGFIDDQTFSSFRKLYSLFMYKNSICKLERTMFPNPANELRVLDFGNNKLESLPKDIFTNMPVLNFINLENNVLRVLDAETYKGLMSRKKLHLTFEGNKIYCCSNMEWILAAQSSANILGTCDRPARLAGKKIAELRREDIANSGC